MTEDVTSLPVARAIAVCLRRMDSTLAGEVLAGAIALRRVLHDQDRRCADLASWILAMVELERDIVASADEQTAFNEALGAEYSGKEAAVPQEM